MADGSGRGADLLARRIAALRRPASVPEPSAEEVVRRLSPEDAAPVTRMAAVAEAAYGGRLRLAELRALRRSGLLPYNADDDE